MQAFIGVLLGGIISVTTTLMIDSVRARRELRHRWDEAALEAVAQFSEDVTSAAGHFFDEGRSRFTNGPESPLTVECGRLARVAMDKVRVDLARTRLIIGKLSQHLEDCQASLVRLKGIANSTGFDGKDGSWREAKDELNEELERLLDAAAEELLLRRS